MKRFISVLIALLMFFTVVPADYTVLAQDSNIDTNLMMSTIEMLSANPRGIENQEIEIARQFITNKFTEYGLEVTTQEFETELTGWDGNHYIAKNIIGTLKPNTAVQTSDILILGAHYDGIRDIPAANDNASGMAVMLELARVLHTIPTDTEIRFIAFDAEEKGLIGSAYYASNLGEDTDDAQMQQSRISGVEEDIGSPEDLLAEEAIYQKIKDEAKDNEIVVIPYELPAPSIGMVVIYGTDGQINRIYSPETKITPFASVPDEGTALPYPSRLSPNTYQYGAYPNAITITSSHVLGEGRFTVYRAGVGGSGHYGSSGKYLDTGDVATKQSVDNARHNTPLQAHATTTDVLKTVYKNDIGYMENSVIDVYFWGWSDPYFGYMYSDTLSFPGRYYYEY